MPLVLTRITAPLRSFERTLADKDAELNPEQTEFAKRAIAGGVLAGMPSYDELLKEVGAEQHNEVVLAAV